MTSRLDMECDCGGNGELLVTQGTIQRAIFVNTRCLVLLKRRKALEISGALEAPVVLGACREVRIEALDANKVAIARAAKCLALIRLTSLPIGLRFLTGVVVKG
jgi:hypothetical protein